MTAVVVYLLLGCAAGLLAGLLGVGGGLIIVPVLVWQFTQQGLAGESVMHMALATSLATIVPTSLSSMRAHHRHGAVRWTRFAQLTPGILLGAFGGAMLAGLLPGRGLQVFFALFELAVAAQLGLNLQPPHWHLQVGRVGQAVAGMIIGLISALAGIGGGTLTVPWLLWNGEEIRKAVATSSACGLPIALAGAAGFVFAAGETGVAWSSGYVYWPAFVFVAGASILFAPLGAGLAHRIDRVKLRRLFALFLCVAGFLMLRKNFV